MKPMLASGISNRSTCTLGRKVWISLVVWLWNSASLNADENQEIANHAARCAAYFFSAANAKGVAEYEKFYQAGEYAFNISVAALDNEAALQAFGSASKEINTLMQRRWSDFYKVEREFEPKCKKLLALSEHSVE